MSSKKSYSVEYTLNALQNAQEIIQYIETKFSKKETRKFLQLFSDFETIIVLFPEIYPESNCI